MPISEARRAYNKAYYEKTKEKKAEKKSAGSLLARSAKRAVAQSTYISGLTTQRPASAPARVRYQPTLNPTKDTGNLLTNLPNKISKQIMRMTKPKEGAGAYIYTPYRQQVYKDFDENGVSVLTNSISTKNFLESGLFFLTSDKRMEEIIGTKKQLTYNWTDDENIANGTGYKTIFDKYVNKDKAKREKQKYFSGHKRYVMFLFNYGGKVVQPIVARDEYYAVDTMDYSSVDSSGFTAKSSMKNIMNARDGLSTPSSLSASPPNLGRQRTTTDLMAKKNEKYAKMAMMKPSMKMGAK